MLTKFIYDKNFEAQRLLNVYWSLSHGIYSSYGFYMLPYLMPGNPKVVYLPKIKNFNSAKIVEYLSGYNRLNVPLQDEKLLAFAETIEKNLDKEAVINLDMIKKVEADWTKIEQVFEGSLLALFPYLRKYQLKLNVYWTKYGSLMSYNEPFVRGVCTEATIFLREDMGVSQIVEGFLSSLLSAQFEKRKLSWLQRETLVDFLALDTTLASFAPEFFPTVLASEHETAIEGKIIEDSQKYLKKLGLEKKVPVESKNGLIYIHGLPAKTPFGPLEIKFLDFLIKNPNEPVSYFDLSDQIWPDNEDAFSLWALSQLAYKIKNKLRKNGISPEVIRNARGTGYIFTPQA